MAVRIGDRPLTGAEIQARYRARHPELVRERIRAAKRAARLRDPEGVRAKERANYALNRERVRAGQAAFRAERKAQLDALKDRPCADCGQRYAAPVMEFDHLPGTEKLWNVSRIVHKKPWADVVAEIAKCEVVCANCHRMRTHARRAA